MIDESTEIGANAETFVGFSQKRGPGKPTYIEVHKPEIFVATGERRIVRRTIDRENYRYRESIVDARGDTVRHIDEPLSRHIGYGSAKRKKNRKK